MADHLERACSMCNQPGVLMCSRCRDPYCSNQCQVLDWHNHKKICFPMPHLIKSVDATVDLPEKLEPDLNFPQKLENDLNVCVSKKRFAHLAPLRKPNVTKTIEITTEKVATSNVVELTKSKEYSFKNPLYRNQFYPGFQTNDPLKAKEIPKSPSPTIDVLINQQLKIAESSKSCVLTEAIFDDSKIGKVGELKIDIETPTSYGNPEREREQVSTNKLSDCTSNLFQISPITTSKPLLHPIPKQVTAATSSSLNEIWMKPFPIEENVFVSVVVQFATKDSKCVWVMLQNNESACNDLLRDINSNISATPNVKAYEIQMNQLYLVEYDSVYHRGVSLKLVEAIGFVLMRLIDYGNKICVPNDTLKKASSAAKRLNAFSFQIKFLKPRHVEIGDVLNIQIESIGDGNVMNAIFKDEKNFVTKDDLEFVPIPVDVKTNLFCLDFSNIDRGYVSACVNDTEAMRFIDEMNAKISAYCKCSDVGYQPDVSGLCLTKYEDGEWYRAVNLKVIDSDSFNIMFIDYGNTSTVNSMDIRKMSDEFMHNCLMNICYIKGAPEDPTDDYIKKATSYFSEHEVFSVESATKATDAYLIDIPELQW